MRLSVSVAGACLSLGMGATLAWCPPAAAQMESREAISLQNQILELRHELDGLQNGGNGGSSLGAPAVAPPASSGGGGSSSLEAQLLERVQTLEQQNRDMRGELDQLSNQVQQQNAALQKQIGDLSFAVQQGGHATPGATPDAGTAAPVAAAAPQAATTPAHRTPEMALAAGNAALSRRDYSAAQADAQEALSGPRGPRQVDAQFLLAQSLAGQHQYQQSALAYYDAYNRAPRSGRAPDALLGVSASMIALGDKSAACQALAKMHAEFPTPAPRVRSAYTALRSRAACR